MDHLLVHLLGNCHVHSFALNSISLGSSNSTLTIISTFYTHHNFSSILCSPLQPTVSLSLSLSLSSSHQPWQHDPSESSRSSLFSYSILSVNSLFFIYLFIKFIFDWCSISVWVMRKQWKRRRNINFIFGFFVFLCFISEFFLL